jgi:Ca2+-dependent lipid-binding protein
LNAKETLLKIEVWDKDTVTPDDLMGAGTFDLKKVYANPKTPFTCK